MPAEEATWSHSSYVEKVTGLSTPQMTRLIRRYNETGAVALRGSVRRQFPKKYTDQDITLLADVDRAHEWLSGPATRHILRREYEQFGKQDFARLAGISSAHVYNLRRSTRYRQVAAVWEPTRPNGVSIGERRKPDPRGRPGFLRVDTVHQGDWDGAKGVYHINAVDAVTQWQVVGCASQISEQHLVPVLEAMLHQFPFRLLGFHSDNGSEFINRTVARLLEKLVIEFTKSRANRSSDNALVEGKNGAIIRKHIGYGHIASPHADLLRKFYTAHLNPYLNFHRPSGFATVSLDGRGKRRRTYKAEDYATPYEKLKSLSGAAEYLKPKLSFTQLDRFAIAMSDTDCAKKMSAAKPSSCAIAKSNRRSRRIFFDAAAAKGRWKCRACGKSGKPNPGFPLFPSPLGNLAQARFPHSHSPGDGYRLLGLKHQNSRKEVGRCAPSHPLFS